MIKDFVQKHISDERLIRFLDKRSKHGLNERIVKSHYEHNRKIWDSMGQDYFDSYGYLDYQQRMSDIWYGKKRWLWELVPPVKCGSKDAAIHGDYNTCEVIALYNALRFCEEEVDFPKLLSHFETCGITSKGYFGTSVLALKKYVEGTKLKHEMLYPDGDMNKLSVEKKYDAFIITLYNNYQDITEMIHTMCITRQQDIYYLHNAYSREKIKGKSIEEVVDKYGDGKSRIISLIMLKA